MSPTKGENLVPAGLDFFRHNILKKNNLFGSSSKAKWTKGLNLSEGGETLFFAGCGYQFLGEAESTMSLVLAMDKMSLPWEKTLGVTKAAGRLGINPAEIYSKLAPHSHASGGPLRDAITVLRRMGVETGSLFEKEPCCGGPLYYIGFQKDFAERAAAAQQLFQSRGVKRILSMVPSCTFTLQKLYPTFLQEWNVEVRHFVETVWEGIRKGMKFRLPEKVRVTYHDSCVMSRLLGLIEEPRNILRSIEGVEFVDVDYAKGEWSTCCGGGGGFEVIFPEISHILAKNRAKELLETKASMIVTSCPGCLIQLSAGVKELKARGTEVVDMAELLRRALPEE
jgi:heterodisulfide reductase subunit B